MNKHVSFSYLSFQHQIWLDLVEQWLCIGHCANAKRCLGVALTYGRLAVQAKQRGAV